MNIDKRKIALMSKLARYEKNKYDSDRDTNNYFRFDYIFKKTMPNIVIMSIIVAIWILAINIGDIFTNEMFFDTNALTSIFVNSIWTIVFIDIIYLVVCFFVFNRQYGEKKERLDSYYRALDKINGTHEKDRAGNSSDMASQNSHIVKAPPSKYDRY
ncbi:MAG: hypothetical protein ACK5LT_02165 [Lachnospirales bacterium]